MSSERRNGHTPERLGVAPSPTADFPELEHGAVARPPGRQHRRREWPDPKVVAAVAAGGSLGAAARHGVAQLVHIAPGSFPWSTFWTNVSGSLVLGAVLVLISERFPPSLYVRPFLATGVIGAYTTYSTFAVETDVLIKDGHIGIALAYLAASVVTGLGAVWLGMAAARAVPLGAKRERR